MTDGMVNPILLIFCGLDVYMFYTFLLSIFPRKMSIGKARAYGAGAAMAVFVVNLPGDSILNLAVVPIIFLIYALLVFYINLSQAVAYTIIFSAVFSGGREAAFELLLEFMSNILPFYLPRWFTLGGVPLLVIEYFIGFMFLRYIENFTRKLKVGEDKAFPWLLVIYPISSAVILGCFFYMEPPESKITQFFLCFSAFVLYFSNAVVYIALERFRGIINKAKQVELQVIRQNMENKNFQDIRDFNERSQQFIHDIHFHLRTIRELALKGDNQKIIEKIDVLEGKMKTDIEDIIYSSNSILDSVFRDMYQHAKDKEIELSVFVEPSAKVDFMAEDDMISMFGNLIANAIEASGKCRRGERKIEARLFMGNDFLLVFLIKNSYAGPLEWEGEQLLTNKVDSHLHGLGIGIVKKLARKYGGTLGLNTDARESTFSAVLTLSVLSGSVIKGDVQ